MILFLVTGEAVCGRCRRPAVKVEPRGYRCDKCTPKELASMYKTALPTAGPGTELRLILERWLGIKSSASCGCNALRRTMDLKGVEWCESQAGIALILAGMQREHAKRWEKGTIRMPFVESLARALVRLACRRARRSAR